MAQTQGPAGGAALAAATHASDNRRFGTTIWRQSETWFGVSMVVALFALGGKPDVPSDHGEVQLRRCASRPLPQSRKPQPPGPLAKATFWAAFTPASLLTEALS